MNARHDRLTGYDKADRRRIINLAMTLVTGMVARGEIEDSEKAIRAAMPKAFQDAKQVVNAVAEYLCG